MAYQAYQNKQKITTFEILIKIFTDYLSDLGIYMLGFDQTCSPSLSHGSKINNLISLHDTTPAVPQDVSCAACGVAVKIYDFWRQRKQINLHFQIFKVLLEITTAVLLR